MFDDADMDQAVDGALWATFFHQGQVCESGTRLLLPESIHDEFVERLVERAKQIKVGDTMDYDSDLGPLVSAQQRETVESYVRIGKEEGAKLVLGGKRPQGDGFERGYWFEPTIFTEVDNSMTIAQEEIFGPVLSVIKFKDDDDAIRIANDSIYGLASGVWSPDPDRCLETAKRLRAGTVWINDYHLINCIAPFGGYKQSGIGRELAAYGLNEYTEVKHVHWDLGTPKEQKLFGVLSRSSALRQLRLRLLAVAQRSCGRSRGRPAACSSGSSNPPTSLCGTSAQPPPSCTRSPRTWKFTCHLNSGACACAVRHAAGRGRQPVRQLAQPDAARGLVGLDRQPRRHREPVRGRRPTAPRSRAAGRARPCGRPTGRAALGRGRRRPRAPRSGAERTSSRCES